MRRAGLIAHMTGVAGVAVAGPCASSPTWCRPRPGFDRTEGVTRYRGGKGKQVKRKKRSNRLIISKRVRRKHRRAKR